jgi:fucose 4-O-acetylase-like acetyltransferase
MTSSSASVHDLAAATPDTRDRFVDALRAAAILVVVLGHWLIAVVTIDGGRVHATSALAEAPVLQWLTWAFQVMPLFFVVGGFANRAALLAARRRGEASAAGYLRSRIARLGAPVLPLALTWIVAGPALRAAGVDAGTVATLTKVMAQPLWFLAVYLVVSALAPVTLRLHERTHPLVVPAVLTLVTVANDLLRLPVVGYVNYLAVFVLAHQLGYALGDGSLLRWSRPRLAALAAGGLLALVVLTGPGPYPRSMVGVPGEATSNMSPPSLCIIALTAVQLGLVLLVRPVALRALQRRRLWTAVIAVNASIMTVFLWHLTALAVGATLLVGVVHLPAAEVGTLAWWALRLPWLATMTAILGGLVLVVGRTERGALRRRPSPTAPARGIPWVGLAVTAAALTTFALEGFGGGAAIGAATLLYLMRRSVTG